MTRARAERSLETMSKLLAFIVSAAVAASVIIGAAPAAAASPSLLGNDISAPQCAGPTAAVLPPVPAFAIIGVNGGVANTSNPCFAEQVAWAQGVTGGTKQPRISYYVNTANPGLAATWWPSSNQTQPATPEVARVPMVVPNPYGTCAYDASAACAFVYGYSLALDDATVRGVPNPATALWWLDVETANTWSTDKVANRAALEGMAALFTRIGAKVGLYATKAHWSEIIGVVPAATSLAALPSWIALGPTSERAATKACGTSPLTVGGRVSLVQFVSAGFDYNVSCLTFTDKPKPKIAGTKKVGKKLTVKAGSWHPSGAKLTFRWYRNGHAIAKATGKTYTLKKADGGKRITVKVTAKKNGYSTVSKVSTAKKIAKKKK